MHPSKPLAVKLVIILSLFMVLRLTLLNPYRKQLHKYIWDGAIQEMESVLRKDASIMCLCVGLMYVGI